MCTYVRYEKSYDQKKFLIILRVKSTVKLLQYCSTSFIIQRTWKSGIIWLYFLGNFPLINYINPWDDRYPSEYLTSITMKNYSRGKNFSSRALTGLIEEVQRGKNRQQVKFSDSSWEAHINKMLRYISSMLQPLSFPLFQFISLSQTKNVSIQFFMLNAWFFLMSILQVKLFAIMF